MNKLTRQLIVGLLFLLSTAGCDDEKQPKELQLRIETAPSAKAQDDNKSSGVYKGTFVGSSGTFKLVIQLDMIAGLLILDDNPYVLTTKDITVADLGGPIIDAEFTDGSGFIKLIFSVEADGSNPSATLAITGHDDIQIVVLKETSTSQVIVYEGLRYWSDTYRGYHEKGQANIVLDGDTTIFIAYKSLEFTPLISSMPINPEFQSWIEAHGYIIENGRILISGNFGNLGLTKLPPVYPPIYPEVSITGNEIHSKLEWIYESITVGDSVRLSRKL